MHIGCFTTTKSGGTARLLTWRWRLGRPPEGGDSWDEGLHSSVLWPPHAVVGLAEVKLNRKGGFPTKDFNLQVDRVTFIFTFLCNGEKTLQWSIVRSIAVGQMKQGALN